MTRFNFKTMSVQAALACLLAAQAQAGFITNGGFEAGLSGWTTSDQLGSEGSFLLQTGSTSPVTLAPVPAPPAGSAAAMTDAEGPGSHVLYQDFVVPTMLPGAVVRFSLFINNGAPDFYTPDHLDFATPDLNQQARVDLMTTTADPFSTAAGDVLQNLFMTQAGDALVSGYTHFQVDVTSVLRAHAGDTLRLRVAETDNVFTFNLGVDNVDVSAVPEPATWTLMIGALAAIGFVRRRRA